MPLGNTRDPFFMVIIFGIAILSLFFLYSYGLSDEVPSSSQDSIKSLRHDGNLERSQINANQQEQNSGAYQLKKNQFLNTKVINEQNQNPLIDAAQSAESDSSKPAEEIGQTSTQLEDTTQEEEKEIQDIVNEGKDLIFDDVKGFRSDYAEQLRKLNLDSFFKSTFKDIDIFKVLGAYDYEIGRDGLQSYPELTLNFRPSTFGLKMDQTYCNAADMYNLEHPENIFEKFNLFSSFVHDRDIEKMVELMPNSKFYKIEKWDQDGGRNNKLEVDVNMMITLHQDVDDYKYFGKAYGCSTQLMGHLVGNFVVKKHFLPPLISKYSERHQNKPPKCFIKEEFAPMTYRLYNKDECKEFFQILNSESYKQAVAKEPNQYIIKLGADSVQGEGVYLLDNSKHQELNKQYGAHGEQCGKNQNNKIAQKYLGNTLLVDNRKFDFRVFVYIVSVNPLIAYYHDGYLRLSLFQYDPNSNDRKQHLTNNKLAEKFIKELKEKNETYEGKTAQELAASTIWTLDDLKSDLEKRGKVTDPNWLDNYLRPQFKKSLLHIVKMTQRHYWKFSNTFDLFGVDYMIDNDLKLWMIEINDGPAHYYLKRDKYFHYMWRDMFNIQVAYYRSRMKRVFEILKSMKQEYETFGFIEVPKWRKEYENANVNRLEPEFGWDKSVNNFQPIIDENLSGSNAYFGLVDPECVLRDD